MTESRDPPAAPDNASGVSLRHHRPFAFYWLSRVASTIALQMQSVAIGWQMYDLTNNPLDLGLVGLFHFIAAACFVLVAGHVADRYDRRIVVRTCQFVAGLAAATLAAGTMMGWLSREAILGIVLVIGATRTFEQTTQTSLLPTVVPLPLLARATASSASASQLAIIAGPALGGLIYAASPVAVYALCAALYLTASVVVGLIKIERVMTTREPPSMAVLFAGFVYIRRNRTILGAISLDLFAVVLGGCYALLPVFAKDVLGGTSWDLGLLRASPGVGALISALVLTRWPPRRAVGRIVFGAVAAYSVAILVFALSQSLVLSMAAMMVLGSADMVSVVIRMTLIQLETPDDMRGRVSAVNSLFVIASNQLGEFRAGLVAAWLGAVPAVLIGGVGALVVVLIGVKLFSELYRVDTLEASQRR
jgi:MFS family permease